jgi:6-phosphogluconolactonase
LDIFELKIFNKMKRQTNNALFMMLLVSIYMFSNLNCSEKENIVTKKQVRNGKGIIKDTSLLVSHTNNSNQSPAETEKTELVFIGSYGNPAPVYVYKMDTATGALSYICSSPGTIDPSYLAIHPNKKWFYSVNESANTLSAFSFDSVQNTITFINSKSSQGNGPCYVSIDNTGKYVMTANYNSGSIAVCPISADGSLGNATSTDQHAGTGPHAHMIIQASNNFVYNTDLGLDKIFIYSLDTTNGHLSSIGNDASTISGAGPRHIAFHPSQPWAYVVCELKGKIEAYRVNNSTSALTVFQIISTLPDSTKTDASAADIHITPDGKYLYASNRNTYNNIAMYSINQGTGILTLIGHKAAGGSTPRNFVIDPSGKFLLVACQGGNKVITFKINYADGTLVSTGNQLSVISPVCLKFLEVNKEKNNTGIHTIHFK